MFKSGVEERTGGRWLGKKRPSSSRSSCPILPIPIFAVLSNSLPISPGLLLLLRMEMLIKKFTGFKGGKLNGERI
jgi:hypothetical protein